MLEKFHFTRSTGDEISVPRLMDSLSMRKMQKLQKQYKDDGEQLSEKVMEAALGKKLTDEILDDWSMRDSDDFIRGWMSADKEDITVGESLGSQES